MSKKYFILILDCGHVGNNKSVEITRYITAENCTEAFTIGNSMPRVKRKNKKTGALLVAEITYEEYLIGLRCEQDNLYLNIHKLRKCS